MRLLPRHPSRWQRAAIVALPLMIWAVLVVRSDRWPSGDGPHVLGASMRLAMDLRAGEFTDFARGFASLLAPHPPGAYLPWTLAYLVAGPGRWTHLLASAGLLALCWDGVRRLGGGASGAVWLAAPALIWAQAELGGVDLVAATAAVQAVSHLAASDRLQRRPHVIGWGLWMGVGFLSKYTFPMFLWAPCALAGVWVARHQRWPALVTAIGAFFAVAGIWYAARFDDVISYIAASTAPDPFLVAARDLARGPWYAAENLSWYPAAALDAWGWGGAVGLIIGVLIQRRRDAPPDGRALALLAVAGAWLVLAQSVQRQDRYLLPAVPLLAAVAGAARGAGWLSLPGLITLGGTLWTFISVELVPSNRDFSHELAQAGRSWPMPAEAYRPVSLDPRPWRVDEALTAIAAAHGAPDGTVGLLLDDSRGAPGMGLYLFRAGSLGFRWDLATVSVAREAGGRLRSMTFVGPFATEDWPDRSFNVLYSAFTPGDEAREAWLEERELAPSLVWALPDGGEGRLYPSVP